MQPIHWRCLTVGFICQHFTLKVYASFQSQVQLSPSGSSPHWSGNAGGSDISLQIDVNAWHHQSHCNGQLPTLDHIHGGATINSCGALSVNEHVNSHLSPNNQLSANFPAQNSAFHRTPQEQIAESEDLEEPGPYEPELTKEENPHYFSANEILYQAHVERNRRQTTKNNSTR